METALEGWRRWNADWPEPLFHETGVLFITPAPMAAGRLRRRELSAAAPHGHAAAAARRRSHPAALSGLERGRLRGWLLQPGRRLRRERPGGEPTARARPRRPAWRCTPARRSSSLLKPARALAGVRHARAGERFEADTVVLAAGSWTPHLLPLDWPSSFARTGMPVFHLRPADPELFARRALSALLRRHHQHRLLRLSAPPREGVVKIANHGDGRADGARSARSAWSPRPRPPNCAAFLADTFPALAEAADRLHPRVPVLRHLGRPLLDRAATRSARGW